MGRILHHEHTAKVYAARIAAASQRARTLPLFVTVIMGMAVIVRMRVRDSVSVGMFVGVLGPGGRRVGMGMIVMLDVVEMLVSMGHPIVSMRMLGHKYLLRCLRAPSGATPICLAAALQTADAA
jgi:hypothetical protein